MIFLSSLINPLNDPIDPLSIEFERNMEVDFSQPPCYDVSDGEDEEGVDNQEHIERETILPLSFIGPHQYAILEMDYQLKVLLGLVQGRGKDGGCQKDPRFFKKTNSRSGIQAWCRKQLSDFRRVLGYYKGHLRLCSSSLELVHEIVIINNDSKDLVLSNVNHT